MQDQKFKADAGKPDHSLLELGFPNALAFVQATLDYGAKKYEAHSWRKVPDAFNRYDKAARRHRNQRDAGMMYGAGFIYPDDESGLPHVAHELFNLMAQVELYLQDNPMIDVRKVLTPKEPPTAHKYVEPAPATMHHRAMDAMIEGVKYNGSYMND
jgi:hypothetical protein